jgi:hypothetical protein
MPKLASIGKLGNHHKAPATVPTVAYTGKIVVANGSSQRQLTVAKNDFHGTVPVPNWYVTSLVLGQHVAITAVTVSGANYVLTYNGGTAFTGGLNTACTVTTR